ncbi:MAG: diaminopimelate decarboxylase, partial [Clostridiales Family XIII bacterium]|nr:diaminopimelate decarboxylase [Clostridiales Family XIII bacterium]
MKAFESRDGVLHIDGVSSVSLAEAFGTPLYVYAGSVIDQKLSEIRNDFLDRYANTRAAYASKAFLTIAMAEIIEQAGLSLDVVSGGELYTAMRAKFPPERLELHGNNKSEAELATAIEYGVGVIIIDAPDEAALIEHICKEKGAHANVMFRIS